MLELTLNLRLAQEPLALLRVELDLGMHQLERDVATQSRISREHHLAHPAPTEQQHLGVALVRHHHIRGARHGVLRARRPARRLRELGVRWERGQRIVHPLSLVLARSIVERTCRRGHQSNLAIEIPQFGSTRDRSRLLTDTYPSYPCRTR